MKNVILFDDEHWAAMLPLSYTRPVAELRVGILTIREKWERLLDANISYITQDYLAAKFPFKEADDNYIINSSVIPTPYILAEIENLGINAAIVWNETLVAARMDRQELDALQNDDAAENLKGKNIQKDDESFLQILRPNDIFRLNNLAIKLDYDLITHDRISADLPSDVYVKNPEQVFIEEGAVLTNCSLNASAGPIYIGKNSEVMEGAMIRGPFALCDGSQVKMGAKIYGATTIGPGSKAGGEINNVVIQAYSNKGHDGFLGNSVLGEWCNIGADTNTSNLKNNYSEVKLYNYSKERFEKTGTQFCGLIMGDHSKCGINTMFNTGTVVGVGASVFGSGYPRNFIPSFSWGGASKYQSNRIDKMLDVAEIVMARRSQELTETDRIILEHIFYFSARHRSWE